LSDAAKIHTYVNKNETVFPLFKAVLLFNIFSDFIIGRFGVCSMYCKHGDFKAKFDRASFSFGGFKHAGYSIS